MALWLEMLPWLVGMLVLMSASAFFSASEAALFSLRLPERRKLAVGSRAQRLAASLLADPDRLLTAILFWNLLFNMAYFGVASIVGFQLERGGAGDPRWALGFAAGALLTIIFFSEMLPKTLAVLVAPSLAPVLAPLLSLAVRIVTPFLPALRMANLLSRRLIWPHFRAEPYLDATDLARAIDVSRGDAELVQEGRMVLNNIVAMSDIRLDEWMRPRAQFEVFRPPVSWEDLGEGLTPPGYLVIADPDGGEIVAAVDLGQLSQLPADHLERLARPVLYLPWCASVADAFQQMVDLDREVVAVVNEFGDTIGILTYHDLLDTMFSDQPNRSARLLNRPPIRQVSSDVWHVTGVAGIRSLARELGVRLPHSRNATVAGVLQETLYRLPSEGDQVVWGPLEFRVLEAEEHACLLVEVVRHAVGDGEDCAS